ncbi:FAD:protein FMN transferase, partial [Streptococcus pneumoniae]|uniref:FAD:protein FMN transferase n=1 Tax=Streptococcus pneumoniae TaxID=1313 RepID=UPI001CED4112
KKHPLGEKRNHPGSKLRQGFWMVFRFGVNNWGLMTIPVVNKSVVTSGIYERHLTVDGQDYHHIFDSQTGYPVETELASLTIISDKSVDGEIWTTRLFGERPASILWQVESLEGIEVILIDKEGHLSCSSGIPTL